MHRQFYSTGYGEKAPGSAGMCVLGSWGSWVLGLEAPGRLRRAVQALSALGALAGSKAHL